MVKGLKSKVMNSGGPPEGPEEDEARMLAGVVPRITKAASLADARLGMPEVHGKGDDSLLREIVPRLSKDTATLGAKDAAALDELLPPFDSHRRFSVPRKRK